MGKITDTGRMVVKDSTTGETVERVLGVLSKDLTVLRPTAPAAERRGGVRAESLLHDGLCDGHQRAAGEGPDRPRGDGSPDGGWWMAVGYGEGG